MLASTLFEDIPPEAIEARIAACHESVRAMHAYWLAKRGNRAMPRRADIDPAEIASFLPRLMLIDVQAGARRFVYRLVGTAEVDFRGSDPTGKSVAEAFFGGSLEETLACYEYVVRRYAPFCYRDPYLAPDGRLEHDDIIYLPLSNDGLAVDKILVFTHVYTTHNRSPAGSPM